MIIFHFPNIIKSHFCNFDKSGSAPSQFSAARRFRIVFKLSPLSLNASAAMDCDEEDVDALATELPINPYTCLQQSCPVRAASCTSKWTCLDVKTYLMWMSSMTE